MANEPETSEPETKEAKTPPWGMTKKAVEKLVDAKLEAFEAQLVADKRIQPAPE